MYNDLVLFSYHACSTEYWKSSQIYIYIFKVKITKYVLKKLTFIRYINGYVNSTKSLLHQSDILYCTVLGEICLIVCTVGKTLWSVVSSD